MTINLLVADDHAVVRQGVAAILKGSDIQVVAEAQSGNEAIEQAMKLKPDVVLLDVRIAAFPGALAASRDGSRSPVDPDVRASQSGTACHKNLRSARHESWRREAFRPPPNPPASCRDIRRTALTTIQPSELRACH